jgi:dihydropteroate synthase
MGVLNATPDSFYAGSRFFQEAAAVTQALRLLTEGADCVDVGGESTRPGSDPVSVEDELKRVVPVIEGIRSRCPDALISIDTQKSEVARQAFEQGAGLLNDVSALRNDPAMVEVTAQAKVPVVLMHMQGTPQTMQHAPQYEDVVEEVKAFLEERLRFVVKHGIAESRVVLDPGIGFGKTVEHNVTLLRRLREIAALGRPVLVGLSRKMFLGRLAVSSGADMLPPELRLEATLAANLFAVERGASGLRVHDAGATRRTLAIWQALRTSEKSFSSNAGGRRRGD